MKILITGSDHVWSLEKVYIRWLRELDIEVKLFPAQNFFYKYYNASIAHKIIYRAGISGVIGKINKLLISEIEKDKPDVIWVFKGMEILPATLEWIKAQHIFVVNYNTDNPFIFTGAGSGNANIVKSRKLYDLHFTYNLEVKRKLENEGCKTYLLPFGFDLSEVLYDTCCQQKEILKACFIGNPDKERAHFIRQLAEDGISIDLYGHDWHRHIKHPEIRIYDAVYGDDFWKVLRRYRLQLNLMRVHNLDSHNMRSFEIPGVGGLMLAPDTTEHRMFFANKPGVFLFTDTEDCIQKAMVLLETPKADADSMRQGARQMSLECGYSYKDRARAVFECLKKSLTSQ